MAILSVCLSWLWTLNMNCLVRRLVGSPFTYFFGLDVQTLDTMQALCLPLGASISLLVMFFFFDSMQMLFAICTAGKHQTDNRCILYWGNWFSINNYNIFYYQLLLRLRWHFFCFQCVNTSSDHVPLATSNEEKIYPMIALIMTFSTSIFNCISYCRISFGICGRFTGAELMSFSLSITIVCIWILTGHWLLMDGKLKLSFML